ELVVDGDAPDVLGRNPRRPSRLEERVVDLLRDVDRAALDRPAEELLACGDDRDQIRDRSSRRHHAKRTGRHAEELRKPTNRLRLELDCRWSRAPDASVAVDDRRDVLRERRRREAAARHVGEIARPGGVERWRDDLAEEEIEDRFERAALLWRRFAQLLLSPARRRIMRGRGRARELPEKRP